MSFTILLSDEAKEQFARLANNPSLNKRFKAVRKALAHLQTNPRHPSLNTHKFSSLRGPHDEEIFEAYAENQTPGAYRIFWYYGPDKK
jgi:hypothetical protein